MCGTHDKIRQTHLYSPGESTVEPSPIVFVGRDARCRARTVDFRQSHAPLFACDISNAGIDELRQNYLAGTDHADDHLLYLVIEGAAWGISQGFQHKLVPGDLFVAPVGNAAWIQLTEGYAKAVWFHLADTERWAILKRNPVNVHPALDASGIGTVMGLLLREQASNHPGREFVARHYSEIIAAYLQREIEDMGSPAERLARQNLYQLRELLSERLDEEWTVARMAVERHVSTGHLHLLTKRYENQTPMEILRQLRMDRAGTLLLNTTQTIDAISQQVGYRTPYAFSDAFRCHTGQRPGAYRRQGRG